GLGERDRPASFRIASCPHGFQGKFHPGKRHNPAEGCAKGTHYLSAYLRCNAGRPAGLLRTDFCRWPRKFISFDLAAGDKATSDSSRTDSPDRGPVSASQYCRWNYEGDWN